MGNQITPETVKKEFWRKINKYFSKVVVRVISLFVFEVTIYQFLIRLNILRNKENLIFNIFSLFNICYFIIQILNNCKYIYSIHRFNNRYNETTLKKRKINIFLFLIVLCVSLFIVFQYNNHYYKQKKIDTINRTVSDYYQKALEIETYTKPLDIIDFIEESRKYLYLTEKTNMINKKKLGNRSFNLKISGQPHLDEFLVLDEFIANRMVTAYIRLQEVSIKESIGMFSDSSEAPENPLENIPRHTIIKRHEWEDEYDAIELQVIKDIKENSVTDTSIDNQIELIELCTQYFGEYYQAYEPQFFYERKPIVSMNISSEKGEKKAEISYFRMEVEDIIFNELRLGIMLSEYLNDEQKALPHFQIALELYKNELEEEKYKNLYYAEQLYRRIILTNKKLSESQFYRKYFTELYVDEWCSLLEKRASEIKKENPVEAINLYLDSVVYLILIDDMKSARKKLYEIDPLVAETNDKRMIERWDEISLKVPY